MGEDQNSKFVFISYSSQESDLVDFLKADLQKVGITVFTFEQISGGSRIINELSQKLDHAGCAFVPIFSQSYFSDTRVSSDEMDGFYLKYRGEMKGRFAPICLDGIEIPSIFRGYKFFACLRDDFKNRVAEIVSYIISSCPTVLYQSQEQINKIDENIAPKYESYLDGQFSEILRRLNDRKDPIRSISRIVMLGVLCLEEGGQNRKSDPSISAAEIISKIRILRGENARKRRAIIKNYVCSIRYYLYCYCISIGLNKFNQKYLMDPIVNSLNPEKKEHREVETIFDDLEDCVEILLREQKKDQAYSLCSRALSDLGTLAHLHGLKLNDLYEDEISTQRDSSRREHRYSVIEKNHVTHKITIYFRDGKGLYVHLLQVLSRISMNFIWTSSETLYPDRIAKAEIWVFSQEIGLGERINDHINKDNLLVREILGIIVNQGLV